MRIFCVMLICLCAGRAVSQDKPPEVIPPSPTAYAIHRFSTEIGPYTGQPAISIPLYSFPTSAVPFSVSLNYSGTQGIRVQEFASWVGLGWSLGASGAVSRTIRGLADDYGGGAGFWEMPELPLAPPREEYAQFVVDVAHGDVDSEPDLFSYSVNGISGSFLINKQMQVLQIPQTNRTITPHFQFTGLRNELISFDIRDENGTLYEFAAVEKTRTASIGGVPATTIHYDISTWHITQISDHNNTDIISFFYEDFNYETYATSYAMLPEANEQFMPAYNKSQYLSKRLQRISYDNDHYEIKFNKGLQRCDLKGDYVLDNVEVFTNGSLQKRYQFVYSYFAENKTVAVDSPCGYEAQYRGFDDGSHTKRLKLDAIREFGSDGTTAMPGYSFEYNQEKYLPSRHSFSQDHWGFYNGQENATLEPHYYKHLPNVAFNQEHSFFGAANRTPYLEYTKAGVLEKLTYPTGGSVLFDYELHEATNPELQRALLPRQKFLSTWTSTDTINVAPIDAQRVLVTATFIGMQLGPSCSVIVEFNPLGPGQMIESQIDFEDATTLPNVYRTTTILAAGIYAVSFRLYDGIGQCGGLNGSLDLKWNNEMPGSDRNVGGLRVKKMTELPLFGKTQETYFKYILEDGSSSGYAVHVPEYGYMETAYEALTPVKWVRRITSTLPLVGTQGSNVGYARVEIINKDAEVTGKTVKYFINPKNIRDGRYDYYESRYDGSYPWNGAKVYTPMPPPFNSMDWARGLQRAEIKYAYTGSEFSKVAETVYKYKFFLPLLPAGADYSTSDIFSRSAWSTYPLDEGLFTIGGFNSFCGAGGCGFYYIKWYDLFTGRYQLEQTIERNYNVENNAVYQEIIEDTYYDNATYYQPSRKVRTTNTGNIEETRLLYAYDNDLDDFSPDQEAVLEGLVSRNCIAPVVGTKKWKNSILIDQRFTDYATFYSSILPQGFRQATGAAPFSKMFDISSYHLGKVSAFSSRDGINRRYQYSNRNVILEAVNAGAGELFFTSFENESLSHAYSGTGARVASGGVNVSSYVAPVADKVYVLSYMWKASAGDPWEQVCDIFAPYTTGMNFVTSKTSGFIDELRFHPRDAVIKTFYYDSLNRITQVCDANMDIQYFGYDVFGRLINVSDKDSNLQQAYEYFLIPKAP